MLQAALQLELARRHRYNVVVHSAGTSPLTRARLRASSHAQQMFPRMLGHHCSKWVGELNLASYALILCMTAHERREVQAMVPLGASTMVLSYVGDLWDPCGQSVLAYRMQRDLLVEWSDDVLSLVDLL